MKYAMPIAVALTISLSSCGTVVRGANEAVLIDSQPSGAPVTTDIGLTCPRTPCHIKAPRNKAFTAHAQLNGRSGSVRVETVESDKAGAAMAGNIVAGGLIGLAIDGANGVNLDHSPNPALIVLK